MEAVHCICLRVTRHNDKTSIATFWSREKGRFSAVLPAGSGRGAARIKALVMPMSIIEGIADIRAAQEIARLKDVRPYMGGNPVAGDGCKAATALFLCDFLDTVLRQSPPDAAMSEYIFRGAAQLRLVQGTALANFHLVFLYRLGTYLGIEPDTGSYARGKVFDMRDGVFRHSAPLHHDYLVGEEARMAGIIGRTDFTNMHHLRLSRQSRHRMLDCILHYYTLHLAPVSHLASLGVVRDLYG